MTLTSTEAAQDRQELPEADRPFKVEQHGIDFVPLSERWARPRDLFGMWGGVSVQIEYFIYGAILMTFGFTLLQALSLIVLGNISYVLLGACSLQGPVAGTTVFGINRAAYGTNGSRVIAFLNWLTQVGYEVEGLLLIVGAGLVLSDEAGLHPGTFAKVAFVVGAVVIQALLPLFGHATMTKMLRYLVVPLIALYAVVFAFSIGHMSATTVAHGASWQTYMVGLAFTITLSGLGWTENGNDYSRYLPPESSMPAIIGWVFLATAVPEILVMALGAGVGTFLTKVGTSANAFAPFIHQGILPTALVTVFLLAAVIQLFAINSVDLYSSGVTLQAMGLRVKRHHAVLIDSVVCLAVTTYAIFDSSFTTYLSDFVDLMIVWIAPWAAIYLVDWVLRRRRYDAGALQRTDRGGIYWASGGVHWPGIIAQVLGMAAALAALSPSFTLPSWLHPITVASGGADFSVFTGLAVGGGIYLLLARRSVRAQVNAELPRTEDAVLA